MFHVPSHTTCRGRCVEDTLFPGGPSPDVTLAFRALQVGQPCRLGLIQQTPFSPLLSSSIFIISRIFRFCFCLPSTRICSFLFFYFFLSARAGLNSGSMRPALLLFLFLSILRNLRTAAHVSGSIQNGWQSTSKASLTDTSTRFRQER